MRDTGRDGSGQIESQARAQTEAGHAMVNRARDIRKHFSSEHIRIPRSSSLARLASQEIEEETGNRLADSSSILPSIVSVVSDVTVAMSSLSASRADLSVSRPSPTLLSLERRSVP